MNTFIALLILIFAPFASAAQSTFGEQIGKCLSSSSTSDVELNATGRSCLKKMGLDLQQCTYAWKTLDCKAGTGDEIFESTKRCGIYSRFEETENDKNNLRISLVGKECIVNGYRLKGSLPSEFPVEDSLLNKSGKWVPPFLGFPVGLDSVIKKDQFLVSSVGRGDDRPWYFQSGLSCETENDSFKESLKNYPKEWNKLGFTDAHQLRGQRHFGGKKISGEISAVRAIELLKPVSLCGVVVPEKTVLSFNAAGGVCYSVVDGDIEISGIPIALMPNLKKANEPNKTRVVCKSEVTNDFRLNGVRYTLESQTKVILPRIDWNKCDCRTEFQQ